MKPREFVDQRRKQYLAQTLENFERTIEPLLPPHARDACDEFKRWTRRRFGALGADCLAVIDLDETAELNPLGIEIRDRLVH